MNKLRTTLVALALLLILVTDHTCHAVVRVQLSRRMHMQAAALHALNKMNEAMNTGPLRFPGFYDAGAPLSEYPQGELDFDVNPNLPLFGGPEDVSVNPYFIEAGAVAGRSFARRHRSGFVTEWKDKAVAGAKWVGGKISDGASAVADTAGRVKDAVVEKAAEVRDMIWAPPKQICSEYYTVDRNKGETSRVAERTRRRDVLRSMGVPKDGMFHPPNSSNYYRFNYDDGLWQCNRQKSLTSGWVPLSSCSGDDSFRVPLMQNQWAPIASADVLEILQCPEDNGHVFMYKAGMLVTPIWFRYSDHTNSWEWTPYESKDIWMPTSEIKVRSGGSNRYAGRSPVEDNQDIIKALDAYSKFGVGNLPTDFGQNWFVKATRAAWNATIGKVIQKAREMEAKLRDFVSKMSQVKWSDVTGALSTLLAKIKEFLGKAAAFAGRVLGAILYGLLNGILMGLLDHVVAAFNECPGIQQKIDAISAAGSNVWAAVKDFFANLSLSTIVVGARRIFNAILDFMKAIWDVVWGCEKLRNTIGLFLIIIVAGLALNAIMVASGYGAVFKVVLAVVGLIMAVPFIIQQITGLVRSIAAIASSGGDMKKAEDALIAAIRHYFGIIGCILGIIFLVKELKSNAGTARTELANSAIARRFGFGSPQPMPNGATADAAAVAAERGPGILNKVEEVQQGKAKPDPKQLGIEEPTPGSQPKPGEPPAGPAKPKPGEQPTQPKPGQQPKPTVRPVRQPSGKGLLKKQDYVPEEAVKVLGEPAPPGTAPKPGDPLAWGKTSHGPIQGSGKGNGQTLFWDEAAKTWRNGPGAKDPLTGASLEGKAVATSNGKPVVDICKISPLFCRADNQPKSFCQVFPIFCKGGPTKNNNPAALAEAEQMAGLPRQRMPQVTWTKEKGFQPFLDFMKARTGKNVRVVEGQSISIKSASPTQAEINLEKTIGIGEGIVFQGKPPPPALVIENPNGGFWIVDGHHRWSGFKYAAELDPSITTMPVTKITGITPEELFKVLSTMADNPTAHPEVATFAGLLELYARARHGLKSHQKVTAEQAKAAWLEAMNAKLAAAGLEWQDAADADQLWEHQLRDQVMQHMNL